MFQSIVYEGKVTHTRMHPVRHHFSYRLPFFAIDLDELEEMDRALLFFSYNRRNILSIYDDDYLIGDGNLKHRVQHYLTRKGYAGTIHRIMLVTNPRYFGYIFNPVSFFYCYGERQELVCILVEVNNTFKERHFYILDETNSLDDDLLTFEVDKSFHVSPFNDMEGSYVFRFSNPEGRISVDIRLVKDEALWFHARLGGIGRPVSKHSICSLLLKKPVTAMMNYPRIVAQALQLYYRRHLKVYHKPMPNSPRTLSLTKLSPFQRWSKLQVIRLLKRFEVGAIRLILPDGKRLLIGNKDDRTKVTMRITDPKFFTDVVLKGDIGFGEAYTKGYLQTNDLTRLLECFVLNRHVSGELDFTRNSIAKGIDRLRHRMNKNSISRSPKNIEAHYDLSNAFFKTFLDETMTYSSAVFQDFSEPLHSAQLRKIHRLLDLIELDGDDHLLEIGSGWGTLAIEAVKRTGCKVTTVTLSKEQYRYVQERIAEEGLEDHIRILIKDYRLIEGRFDKIVSVEMFEAVGYEHFETYFNTLDRLLKPNGIAGMQVITIADEHFDRYRKGVDWIQKYIFPGGLVPSLSAMQEAVRHSSDLQMEQIHFYGKHYAETLRRWKRAVNRQQTRLDELGFDNEFRRIWNYYLSYCEAGFNQETLDLVQYILRH